MLPDRTGDQNGNKNVSNLLLMVVNPILIITVYQTSYDPELVRGLLFAFAAAAVTHVLGILISGVLIRSGGGADTCIERFSAMYSNCGFIGIPLIGSVLGDTGIFYISAYMVIFNLFSWTPRRDAHGGEILPEESEGRRALADVHHNMPGGGPVLHPPEIPAVLLDSMNYVADMNTPLAMMVAGFSVAQADIGKMCRNLRLYYTSALKLLVFPLCTVLLLLLFRLPSDVAMTTLIAAACPTATTCTMMAIRYKQNYTYASEIFAMSTVLSVVTIPLLVLIAESVL